MITTVTMNPAIDRTITVGQFAFGSVNRIVSSREDIGGKGINVARILLALGSDVKAVGFIGRFNFPQADSYLRTDAIPSEFVFVDAPTRMNTKLLDNYSHTTTDLNEVGFAVNSRERESLRQLILRCAAESEYIVFSGSVPEGLPVSIYRELIAMVPSTCRAVLDADSRFLMEGLHAKPFLIKPNINELESALGRTLGNHLEIVEAAREWIRLFEIKFVLVSMGGSGSILVTEDQSLFAAPLPVDVKGTVGAGDSMLAGFIHGLAQGCGISAALARATACGALAVSQEGTQAFEKADVERLASLVTITNIIE